MKSIHLGFHEIQGNIQLQTTFPDAVQTVTIIFLYTKAAPRLEQFTVLESGKISSETLKLWIVWFTGHFTV